MSESRSKDILAHGAGGWQPIETAPTYLSVLVFIPNAEHYGEGVYRGIQVERGPDVRVWKVTGLHCGSEIRQPYAPTHWMSLPDPPPPRGDVSVAITGVSAEGIAGNLLASRNYNTNTWNNKVPCVVCGNPADFAEHAHGQAFAFHRFSPAPDPPEVKE